MVTKGTFQAVKGWWGTKYVIKAGTEVVHTISSKTIKEIKAKLVKMGAEVSDTNIIQ